MGSYSWGFRRRQKRTVTIPPGEKNTRYYLDPESKEEVKEYLKGQGFPVASTKAEVLRELAGRGCHFAEMLLRYRSLSHDLIFLNS